MLIEHQHPDNKSIMISVLGAPNVGKSTLINNFLGMELSIVTPKAQTTRNRFHCVTTIDRTEIIFVDTPGLHRSNQEFNLRLNDQARVASEGVDLNLLLVDITYGVLDQIKSFVENLKRELGRTWIVFTKKDCIENADLLPISEIFEKAKLIIPNLERYFFVSSKTNDNIHELTGAICDIAPEGPHHYPGEISNKNVRFFATEYIREQAFLLLKEELPYELAVVIDEFKDLKKRDKEGNVLSEISHISASILVNRPSQRAIVVGGGGRMIKEIGTLARKKIEDLIDRPVHLNLHVKVSPKWFKNNFVLEEIGLPRAVESHRVWRKK